MIKPKLKIEGGEKLAKELREEAEKLAKQQLSGEAIEPMLLILPMA